MNNIINSQSNILNKKAVLKLEKDIIKIMAISDTHLGCLQDRVDYLKYFYKYAEECGVDIIIHCGDLTDGYLDYPDQIENLKYKTFADQKEYVIDVYPESSIPTFIIAGNHDFSWQNKEGMDIIAEIVKVRKDLYYLGDTEGIIKLSNLKIGLIHGHKKIAQEIRKLKLSPDIVFKGHSHNCMKRRTRYYSLLKVPCLVDYRYHPGMSNRESVLGVYIIDINVKYQEILEEQLIKCSNDGTKRVLRL